MRGSVKREISVRFQKKRKKIMTWTLMWFSWSVAIINAML